MSDTGFENYWRIDNGVLKAPPDADGKLEVAYQDESVLGFTFINKQGSIETYDADGKLISLMEDDGLLLNFSYSNEVLSQVTTSSGRYLNYTYQEDGRVQSVSSSDGSTWKYLYDEDGGLAQGYFPCCKFKTYHY